MQPSAIKPTLLAFNVTSWSAKGIGLLGVDPFVILFNNLFVLQLTLRKLRDRPGV